MQKIIIISYFYPPANFVGGQRTAAWAKYLHEFGYYPIVITRKWNEGQTDLIDKQENNSLQVEKNDTHEVHRLPYKRSVRDQLSNYPKLKPIQKALTLQELVFSNYFLGSLPFSNFYDYSKELIQKSQGLKFMVKHYPSLFYCWFIKPSFKQFKLADKSFYQNRVLRKDNL